MRNYSEADFSKLKALQVPPEELLLAQLQVPEFPAPT
jgi:hypothetical protein